MHETVMGLGAVGYLEKGATFEAIRAAVRRAVGADPT
jgi:hypothetical protein